MVIVAGHLIIDPAQRDAYVTSCAPVVEAARSAPGCLDFTVTADTIDPTRVIVYERWEDDAQLLAFREGGPSEEQAIAIRDAEVRRYTISAVGDP